MIENKGVFYYEISKVGISTRMYQSCYKEQCKFIEN